MGTIMRTDPIHRNSIVSQLGEANICQTDRERLRKMRSANATGDAVVQRADAMLADHRYLDSSGQMKQEVEALTRAFLRSNSDGLDHYNGRRGYTSAERRNQRKMGAGVLASNAVRTSL